MNSSARAELNSAPGLGEGLMLIAWMRQLPELEPPRVRKRGVMLAGGVIALMPPPGVP